MKTQTTAATTGQDMLIGYILEDIKALWDREGFGSDESVSEPLYARLNAAIALLQKRQN